MKHLPFAALALGIGLGTASTAAGQDRIPLEPCGSALPYSTQISNAGLELQGQLTANALGGLLRSIPVGTEGTVGGEYVAGAIAGAAHGAFAQVVEYYTCRSRNRIISEVNAGRMTEAHLDAFDERAAIISDLLDNIRAEAISYDTESDMIAAIMSLRDPESDRIREAMEQPLDPAIRRQVDQALRGIEPTDFTRLNRVIGWGQVRTNIGQIGGCGGVITNVLEGAHGDLQAALSTTPSWYRSFFNGSPSQAVTKSRSLIVSFAGVVREAPPSSSVPDMSSEFQACSRAVLARLDPEAAAQLEIETTGPTSSEATTSSGATDPAVGGDAPPQQPTSPPAQPTGGDDGVVSGPPDPGSTQQLPSGR